MKKTILLSLMASSFMMAQNSSILDNEFQLEPSIAVLGGLETIHGDSNQNAVYGVELGFNCLATSAIRQQIQITHYEDNDLKISEVTLNPYYYVPINTTSNDNVKIGFGPTVGFTKVDNGTDSDTLFTYGLGTNLTVDIDSNYFLGAEVKYELTDKTLLTGFADDADNLKVFAKAGYRF